MNTTRDETRSISLTRRVTTKVVAAVVALVMSCTLVHASLQRVPVPRDSKLAKDLGVTIKTERSIGNSELAGTVAFYVRAPRTPPLVNLSRIILRTQQGMQVTGRVPLELQKGESGAIGCHFLLTPDIARTAVLELVCPIPDMPNGVIYEISLSDYLDAER